MLFQPALTHHPRGELPATFWNKPCSPLLDAAAELLIPINILLPFAGSRNWFLGSVVGQFAVAALYECRNPLNQKPAVIDRRYKKPK
jgi:hypothetical protein